MNKNLTNADVFGGLAFVGFMLGLTMLLIWNEGWDLLCYLFGI